MSSVKIKSNLYVKFDRNEVNLIIIRLGENTMKNFLYLQLLKLTAVVIVIFRY